MRRGPAVDCARAVAGNIARRSGSAMPTPTPRSIVRREIVRSGRRVYLVVFNIFCPSFVSEKIALYDRMHDVAGSVAGAAALFEDSVCLFAIRKADRRARTVGDKLADEVSCHASLLVIEQELFEFANTLECAAIGKRAGGIHRQSVVEGERLTRKADTRFRLDTLGECAIAVAPTAHDVEALQRESRGIDLTMARSASWIGAVPIELLTDRDRASDIRLQSRHARGRRSVESENAFHDPDAAQDRRRRGAVRRDLQDTRLRHDSAADRIFRQRDLAHSDSVDAGDAVMFRESLIEEGEVGIDDGARRKVPVEHLVYEQSRFFDGGELEWIVEFVIVVKRSGGGAIVDLAEVEPVVGERIDEPAGPWVIEQTIGLRSQDFGIAEPPLHC